MVKVGLVTCPSTPSARHAPRTNVVLPEPRSPETVTTSPGSSSEASLAAMRSVSSGEDDSSSMFLSLEEAELDGGLGGEQRLGLRSRLERAAEELGDAREVLLEHAQHRGRVERSGGVIERIEQHAAPAELDLLLLAVDARDPGRLAGQELRREV